MLHGSGLHSQVDYTRLHEDDGDPDDIGGAESGARRKKAKFSRSRIACLPCRTRKNKCGSIPPDPCQNCIDAGLDCHWPTADGRSSQARLQRSRSAAVKAEHPDVKPAVPIDPQLSMGGIPSLSSNVTGPSSNGSNDWLERLLSGGPMSASPDGPPAFMQGPLPSTLQTGYDPNLPGPSNYAFMQSPAASTSTLPLFSGMTPGWSGGNGMTAGSGVGNAMDPAHFMWAMSSQLPMVEESSPADERSNVSGPSPMDQTDPSRQAKHARRKPPGGDGKIVKISWWRPHGQTAIAPGLKRITLKVRVDTPQEALAKASPHTLPGTFPPEAPGLELVASDGAPSTLIMRHLLDVFMQHFGCQFPFLDKRELEQKIESRTGNAFLLNCIAGLAARFSSHPAIALPSLEPWAYGNVFYNRAKALLGSMLSVPSREAIAGFVMLAHMSFANDSESELWMLTGMAVRMSIDLGLHINPPDDANITQEDRRLNRLVFFTVVLMDYALSFGVGRQTTFRVEDITQIIPTEADIHPPAPGSGSASAQNGDTVSSPFAYAAHMMLSYGYLINILNREQTGSSINLEQHIQAAKAEAIREYNQLPQDMQWNVSNLQRHCRANQGPIFLYLHLWMHTILASGYLTGSNLLRRGRSNPAYPAKSGAATPNSATASTLWRNSVRTIGDILVLSDIINPQAYYALPFTNQAFFVASCCYVKEIDQHGSQPVSPTASPKHKPRGLSMTPMNKSDSSQQLQQGQNADTAAADQNGGRQVDLSRALLTSVAKTNIATLQAGLAKQATYWSGVAWVMAALEKRIEGIQDVDLSGVTEKLKSFVSLPDAGLIGRAGVTDDADGQGQGARTATGNGARTPMPAFLGMGTGNVNGNGGMPEGSFDFNELDFLSLPFDMGSLDGTNNVTETEVPLSEAWQADWFR